MPNRCTHRPQALILKGFSKSRKSGKDRPYWIKKMRIFLFCMDMKKIFVLLAFFCMAPLSWAAQDSRFEQGARFESAGQYEKALGEYRAILTGDPHNAQAFWAAGNVRFKMKDYKGAIANFQLAYKYAPKMAEAYEGSAKAYEKLGDKGKAEAERKKNPNYKGKESPSVKENAKAGTDILAKTKAAFEAKDYKAACAAAREVLTQEPGNSGAYYYAGAGRYELGEFDKAEYNLKRSFGYAELGFNAHYYLALIYKKQGKKDLEKAELQAYIGLSKNESAIVRAKSRLAEISDDVSESATQVPEEKTETSKIESAKSEELRTPSAELPEKTPVDSVKKKVPSPEPKKVSENPMERANEAYRQGDYAAALSLYQALQKKYRDENMRAYLLFQIGNVYRIRRDFRSAVSKYRELVELYPNGEWAVEAQRAWEDAVWQEKNAELLPR